MVMDLSKVVNSESEDQLIKTSKLSKKKPAGKIGRPALSDDVKRSNKIVLYFTADEIEKLKTVCGKKSISMYIRDKILFQFK